jgi:CxxC-x17-CxxC domain-containing protein
VECKFWNRRIPQEKLFALKTIVEDVGASEGILISQFGIQKGSQEYVNHPVNVKTLTFAQLRSELTGRPSTAKPLIVEWMERSFKRMTIVTCARCGVEIEVPFPPSPGKSTVCRACYESADEQRQESLVDSVGFDLLGEELGSDIRSTLEKALAGGAVFHKAHEPLSIFRQALVASIREIQSDPRGRLFQEFLLKGPYEHEGAMPPELLGQRLSDEDTTTVIAFIYSHMVNSFKGALAEMLATEPCLHIVRELQAEKRLPREARLYVGDAVWAASREGEGFAKGADLHILTARRSPKTSPSVAIGGVAEVKSYICRPEVVRRQLDRHIVRAQRGLRVGELVYAPEQITVGWKGGREAVRIAVLPAKWKLPRTFSFKHTGGRKFLQVKPGVPKNWQPGVLPDPADSVERVGPLEWRVTLCWSKEALDAAAYEMTFWYMEKVGEVLYSNGVPKGWERMTPAEAGQNAAKMMLYYAILRCRTVRENHCAIALYNSYSFGCALGMNFRNAKGQRQMLWPQDLDEILATGQNKDGCKIV